MDIDYSKIGKRLALIRGGLQLTQEEVSAKAGISLNHYAHIESGRGASLSVFVRIVNALGVSCDYVLADVLPTAKYVLEDEWAELLQDCTIEQIETLKLVAKQFGEANK